MDSRTTAAARVLALIVSADGRVDRCELDAIDRLDGFSTLGIDRASFVGLAAQIGAQLGGGPCERSWLTASDEAFVDHLLDAVADPQQRITVGRLGAAAIDASGEAPLGSRLVFGHAMARWRIPRDRLAQPAAATAELR